MNRMPLDPSSRRPQHAKSVSVDMKQAVPHTLSFRGALQHELAWRRVAHLVRARGPESSRRATSSWPVGMSVAGWRPRGRLLRGRLLRVLHACIHMHGPYHDRLSHAVDLGTHQSEAGKPAEN